MAYFAKFHIHKSPSIIFLSKTNEVYQDPLSKKIEPDEYAEVVPTLSNSLKGVVSIDFLRLKPPDFLFSNFIVVFILNAFYFVRNRFIRKLHVDGYNI